MITSKSTVRVIDWLLAVSFMLAVFAHAYLGSYSRYMGDDYNLANIVREHGLLASQIRWYRGWTGRFSFSFVASLLGLVGPATPPFIPGLLLALWFVATVWAIYQIHSLAGATSWVRVLLFAGLIIFTTLETTPNVVQSLYWQTGALTYVAPLIPLSLFIGLFARVVRKGFAGWIEPGLAAVLMFVAGGFSDAYVVMQSCGLILLILANELFGKAKTKTRSFLVVGLIGSLLALAIVALAPGNTNRQSFFPTHLGSWAIVGWTLFYSVGFVAKLLLDHPIVALTSLALPLLIQLRDSNQGEAWMLDRRLLFLVPVAVLLVIMSGTAPALYAMSVMLPERARILLTFVFVCGCVVWSRAAGEYLRQALHPARRKSVSLAATVALFLLILVPQISFFSTLRLRERARSYAADWDRQALELKTAKQQGVGDVAVEQIGDFQWRIGKRPADLHMRTDPTFWINRATATYYGLNSVRATDSVR